MILKKDISLYPAQVLNLCSLDRHELGQTLGDGEGQGGPMTQLIGLQSQT